MVRAADAERSKYISLVYFIKLTITFVFPDPYRCLFSCKSYVRLKLRERAIFFL